MILRGIDRAHDIDCGPSNGTHTRGPVSGGLVQPAPPIPSGRKGVLTGPRGQGGYLPDRRSGKEPRDYKREWRERYRQLHPLPPRVECGKPMRSGYRRPVEDGQVCARRIGHDSQCKSRSAMNRETARKNAQVALRRQAAQNAGVGTRDTQSHEAAGLPLVPVAGQPSRTHRGTST